jgi:hypothetical protein
MFFDKMGMMILILAALSPFIKINIETILYLHSTLWYPYILTMIVTIFILKVLKEIWLTLLYICEKLSIF